MPKAMNGLPLVVSANKLLIVPLNNILNYLNLFLGGKQDDPKG
jgi:hypothetical protein